jgi:threonine aldolase
VKIRIDMRSDTVTLPPDGMRKAIAEAELGDDFYHDDPTVKALEEKAAEMLGKESALLVLSGTMGNLVSVMTQARPGTEAIVEQEAHIFKNEGGGMARVAGVMPRRIPGVKGALDPGLVESQIGTPSVLNHGVSLICVEQTHNGASGTAIPLENIAALRKIADRAGAKVHMDGARVFNAATTLGVPVSKVVENVDSVTFCLSKGLCCPLGAVVAGSKDFIEEARFNRQAIGGGMRQAGVIAAAGIYALDHMVDRLAEDHRNAKRLATILAECGFEVDLDSVQSNIVRFKTAPLTSAEFRDRLNAEGIDVLLAGQYGARFVTHWPVTADDIEFTGKVIRKISSSLG